MNVSVEQLEGHMAKLTIELEADALESAIEAVYKKQRSKINVPGFRKGKAPRVLIEKMYGPEVFYEDAADKLITEEYPNAYDESGLDIVSRPEVDIIQLEKGKPFIFTALVATRPDVELGKYKGVTVTRVDVSVTDEEIEEEVKRVLSMNSRNILVDRPIQKDDTVNIDYSGKTDGKVFDGGTATGQTLTIGSNTFIPGFEDQLIGKSAGEEFDINVTFPEEYHAKELAGKPAVFTVKVNEVRCMEAPELNDEYVQDISEFETVAEYKKDIQAKLEERKAKSAERQKQEEAIEKIVADSKMEIPPAMYETQLDNMMNEYSSSLRMQGISLQQYFSVTGMTPEAMREQMRGDAERQVRTSLVLEAIAKEENIEATEEEVDEKLKETAEIYRMSFEDIKNGITDAERENIKKDIQVEKAVKLVGDNVKERAKPKKKEADDSDEKETKKKTTKKEKKED